jgi:hypothetical protein
MGCHVRLKRRLAVYQYLPKSSQVARISRPRSRNRKWGSRGGEGGRGRFVCGSAALRCLAGFNLPNVACEQRSADYKSAIRQIKNEAFLLTRTTDGQKTRRSDGQVRRTNRLQSTEGGIRRGYAAARGADIAARCPYQAKYRLGSSPRRPSLSRSARGRKCPNSEAGSGDTAYNTCRFLRKSSGSHAANETFLNR